MNIQNIIIYIYMTVVFSFGFFLYYTKGTGEFEIFTTYTCFSFLSYIISDKLIEKFKLYNLKANLFGYDINKKGTEQGKIQIPESLGIVPATVFLMFNMVGILLMKFFDITKVFEYTSGLLGICVIIFLGFSDDVLDLPWRYKLILPSISTIPLLVAYCGPTVIKIPFPVRSLLGEYMELGIFYFLYMGMLAIFCTNSINIYAGINGLEVGQSLIISATIMLHNLIEISITTSQQVLVQHQLSLSIIIPFIFPTLALFKYNQYPSKVFVGDTFCYWSGMTFAVTGILGHFSKTLLLFFVPQILNFLISLPQLFKIIPCPRHRLPRYNVETKKLECVTNHWTLINLFLKIFGPTSEKNLTTYLILFQIMCCSAGVGMRYYLAHLFF